MVTLVDGRLAFDLDASTLAFNTPDWFETIKFAVEEAAKRKMRVCFANCSGWRSATIMMNYLLETIKQHQKICIFCS